MEPQLDLHLDDAAWAACLAAEAKLLPDDAPGQLELWPVDDLLGQKSYVACPRRGTHAQLTDCWMCWCDVAWGFAAAAEVLGDGDL